MYMIRNHPRMYLALFILAVAVALIASGCGHDFGPDKNDSGFWF